MRLNYVMSDEVKRLGLHSSVVAEVTGLTVAAQSSELEELKAKATAEIMALSDDAIDANVVLGGYRDLVRGIGRSLKRFPPAGENLIRQIKRLGRFPTINCAVDSYNLVVARRFLALGVHDIAKVGPIITFRLSPGGEPFTAVGSTDTKFTQRGDYVYADENRILAWLDSKDSDAVKITTNTVDLVIVIQGTARTDLNYNCETADEACRLITRYCGGAYEILPLNRS